MPTARPARPSARLALLIVAAAMTVALGGCHISWRVGATHGAIIEAPAARASVGIWRAPTRLLAQVERSDGIRVVQDILCASGRFPALRVAVGGRAISADVLSSKWCGYVRGDAADLRGALRDSQSDGRDECLALTLVSRGAYLKNWTHKSVGCRTGSLA